MRYTTRRRLLDAGVIFALALGIRVLYLADLSGDPFAHDLQSNAELYHEQGQIIAGGGKLSATSGAQPLYPYLVGAAYAVAGPSPAAVRLAQAVLGAATAALLALLAAAMSGRRAALIVGVLWSVSWPAVFYGGELLPDTVVCACLAGAFAACWMAVQRGGAGWWTAAAACLCLGALGKPNVLVLTPWPLLAVLTLPDLERSVRIRRALAALVLPVAVLATLVAGGWMYDSDSRASSTAFAAKSLWDGNHAHSDGVNPFMAEYPDVLAWEVWQTPEDHEAIAQAFRGDMGRFIREQPGAFLALQGRKALIYLHAGEVGNNMSVTWRRHRSTVLSLPLWPGFGALLALALAGAMAKRREWRSHVLAVGWTVTWSASIVAIVVAGRHRMVASEILCLYAGIGVVALVDAFAARERRPLAVLLAAVAIGALAVCLDPLGLGDYRIASILQQEAQVLERADDLEGAQRRYQDGIDLERGGAALQRSYGLFLLRGARPEAGLAALQTAAARAPQDASVAKDLGGALRDAGRPLDALPELQRAATLNPSEPGIQYNLGLVLADLGRLEEAQQALTTALEAGMDDGEIWLQRGVVRARMSSWDGALHDLSQAAQRLPGDCRVAANLGLVQERLSSPQQALETYLPCAQDPVIAPRLERLRGGAKSP